jgi:hypothetical protein
MINYLRSFSDSKLTTKIPLIIMHKIQPGKNEELEETSS